MPNTAQLEGRQIVGILLALATDPELQKLVQDAADDYQPVLAISLVDVVQGIAEDLEERLK